MGCSSHRESLFGRIPDERFLARNREMATARLGHEFRPMSLEPIAIAASPLVLREDALDLRWIGDFLNRQFGRVHA